MDTKVFKKLIKEAVIEALREEFKQILAEHAASQLVARPMITENYGQPFNTVPVNREVLKSKMDGMFGSTQNRPTSMLAAPVANDFSAFLIDSAETMTPQELSGLKNLG